MDLQELVSRLRRIKEEKDRLNTEELVLSSPSITDLGKVGDIFELCKEAVKESDPRSNPLSAANRRKSLFVILYLFSPKTLAGGKMSLGLRNEVARVMNISPSNVSHCYKNAWFFYEVYKDFREEVNDLFARVFEKLKKNQ